MACELCNRHARIGRKRILKFRRGRGVADPQGGEFLARVDKGIIRFTWDCWQCDRCDRTRIHYSIDSALVAPSNEFLAESVCSALFYAWDKPDVADHCRWIAGQLQKLLGVGNE